MRARLFETLALLGSALGADRTAVLVLDDMQWAETRGLPFFIEALIQLLFEQGVLPVTGDDRPSYDFAAAMAHIRSVAQVPMPPGVREVIQARLAQQTKQAGALLDEPVFRYSVRAGNEAFAAYATQEALAHFDTARDVARRMDDRGQAVDKELLGSLYRGRGRLLELLNDDEAVQDNYEEMRRVATQRQDRALELDALLSLSNLYGQYTSLFNPIRAREMAQEALGLARELGMKELVGHILNGLCWPLFAGLDERTRPYREAGFLRLLADEYWLRARAEMALGQYDSAREALLKAKEAAEGQGQRAVLWRILVSLAEVEETRGDEAAAAGFFNQAREVVDYITENAGELREIFLARPDVEAILASN